MRNYITLLLIALIVSFIAESLTNPVTAFVVINDRKVASCVQRESIPSAITFFGKSSIDVLNRQNHKNAFQQQQTDRFRSGLYNKFTTGSGEANWNFLCSFFPALIRNNKKEQLRQSQLTFNFQSKQARRKHNNKNPNRAQQSEQKFHRCNEIPSEQFRDHQYQFRCFQKYSSFATPLSPVLVT